MKNLYMEDRTLIFLHHNNTVEITCLLDFRRNHDGVVFTVSGPEVHSIHNPADAYHWTLLKERLWRYLVKQGTNEVEALKQITKPFDFDTKTIEMLAKHFPNKNKFIIPEPYFSLLKECGATYAHTSNYMQADRYTLVTLYLGNGNVISHELFKRPTPTKKK